MNRYRVVCTKNPENIIIDFAAADNSENSIITHENLLKLRQYHTPESEAYLPPLFLTDNDGAVELEFDKPEKASPDEKQRLTETRSRIVSSYNRFQHRGGNSTLEITEETLAIAYSFINPYQMETNSLNEEEFRDRLQASKRLINTKAMKENMSKKRPSLMERFYKTNGD